MTTLKQTDANRRNAKKSTGPRTRAGKTKSSMNSLKHGIFAKVAVVPGMESEEEWEAHRQGCWEAHRPVGPAEEILVLAANADAASELVRSVALEKGAAFGWHRLSLPQFAATLAAPLLAERMAERIRL